MKNCWRVVVLILCLNFLFIGCANPSNEAESKHVKVCIEKASEWREVDLDHPLYNRRNWDYSFRDLGLVGTIRREEYEYLQNLAYEKQDIYSAEQAIKYYEAIDPWNLIKNYSYVVAEIHYDAEYDVWGIVLCHDYLMEEFLQFKDTAEWWIYIRGNGEILYRLE